MVVRVREGERASEREREREREKQRVPLVTHLRNIENSLLKGTAAR